MGDQDFLGAPVVQHLGGRGTVVGAGQNLCLGGVGLQEPDVGQHLLLLRPVVIHHAAVFHTAQHGLDVDGHHGVLRGEGDHLIGDIAAHQTRQMPDFCVDGGDLVGLIGLDHAVHRGGTALPVRRMVDVLRHERGLAVQGKHSHIGGRREGGLHIHHSSVRLGQHRDLVAHVGGRKTGVIHRAAGGLDGGTVVVHVGVLGDLADDEGIKLLAHVIYLPFASPRPLPLGPGTPGTTAGTAWSQSYAYRQRNP